MRRMLAGLAFSLTLALAGSATAQPPANFSDCNSGCNDRSSGSGWFNWRPGQICKKYCDWVKAPCPNGAPTRRVDAPLAFKSHPYARSPRDYFMAE